MCLGLLLIYGSLQKCANMRGDFADCSGIRSGGVRVQLRGSDLLQPEVNDVLEQLF